MNRELWTERREDWRQREDDGRTPYEVDYSRIIHSASFRRLAGVTQILPGAGSFRTRLTHSMEVGQIAMGIAQVLRNRDIPEDVREMIADMPLVQTIGLVHDLGHPPFGHAGEEALNCSFRDVGGFEGNGQTLRILSRLEDFSEVAGSNLTRRTLLGTLKYQIPYSQALTREIPPPRITESGVAMIIAKEHKPPKCYLDTEEDIVSWLLAPFGDEASAIVAGQHKSFDASLMDLADDNAYSVGDLEDAVALNLITREQLLTDVPAHVWADYIDYSRQRSSDTLFGDETGIDGVLSALFMKGRTLKQQIGRMTGYIMSCVILKERSQFSDPIFRYAIDLQPHARQFVEALKGSILKRVILSPKVQHSRFQGQQMLLKVVDVLRNDPRHYLVEHIHERYKSSDNPERIIADYVSGLTDEDLTKLHNRMFQPGEASVFDRL